MKRPINSYEAANGKPKVYWRGVEEYSKTAEFQQWLDREFPQGASEFWGDGVSRRSFVRLMGASMALAGLGMASCRRPEAHLVPFTKTSELQTTGLTLNFATSMPRRRGGVPLLVTSYQGRPIKIEGNPLHPLSKGKSDTFAQASLLNLYDPDRSWRFLHANSEISADQFFKDLDTLTAGWAANGGKGLAFLGGEVNSPTLNRLRAELLKKFPQATWTTYEPGLYNNEWQAAKNVFGQEVKISPRYDKAEVILSLDCDFLGSDDGTLASIRDFTEGRKVENPNGRMNRLYVVESRYSNTGGMADHRLRLPASKISLLASALLAELKPGSLAPELPGVDAKWITEAARDLAKAGKNALVVVGAGQPAEVHQAALMLNSALGAIGNTVELLPVEDKLPKLAIQELAKSIGLGLVTDLVILGGNPVYNAPADLDFASVLGKVKNIIRLGSHEDETTAVSGWHAPLAEYLEAWGDTILQDGSYGCVQPLILPLHNGLSEIQLVAKILGQPLIAGPELVQETFKQRGGTDATWPQFVHDGFVPLTATVPPITIGASPASMGVSLASLKAANSELGPNNLELVFVPDSKVDDGRFSNNGWLQELPDFMTKLTWDNAALISPLTAKSLGLDCKLHDGTYYGDVIKITVDGRSVEAPVLIALGQADYTITLPLGYGRKISGKVGKDVGFSAYEIRSSLAPYVLTGAQVVKTGKTFPFSITQEHWSMEGRDLVREAPLAYYKEHPDFTREVGEEAEAPPLENFYKSPGFDFKKDYQWGMVIDLSSCVGCNACVISCQAENNIPIVGKEQVRNGREMHWMRVDRYYSGSQTQNERGIEAIPNDPEVVMQPVTCMQCDNAPCETVCPVNATVHSEEGLNLMVYNRCIGTRYCANNCPYKTRRFNFFDYNQRQLDKLYLGPLGPKGTAETIKLSKNPDVTVRMRGVMEKCTFCIQRIEKAKITWKIDTKREGGKMPGDAIQTACQQSCPADAIVFGDISDPNSRVSKLKKRELNYQLLAALNTQPRLSYLSRLRNPNPLMPGAERVGMGLINAKSHGEGAKHE
ncbi:MAG: TAT-variant-translocated molybdopterin oxidoreductase [Verrucomicrobiales bacterium]|jgi:molybdopterin-containing oxidoreductase family iron-sulfur binding subunit|nr:TAT-variant-translocated molybdopterin oxidoreductase [Verrucomicrobiales bacterium]